MNEQVWQKKWVIGNWKMNGQSETNLELIKQFNQLPKSNHVNIGVTPPSLYIMQVRDALQNTNNNIEICAQDVSRFADKGAYTGEISANMLAEVGVRIVLVGHSERNQYFNEKNEVQRLKLENVLNAGLTPLLCVGENLKEREDGREKELVSAQLSVFKDLNLKQFTVAYEPVWAIGTGKVASTEQIADMHQFIYDEILSLAGEGANIRILYGGSVNEKNAADIFSVPHVDGALVGGASLKYDSFAAIIQAAQQSETES